MHTVDERQGDSYFLTKMRVRAHRASPSVELNATIRRAACAISAPAALAARLYTLYIVGFTFVRSIKFASGSYIRLRAMFSRLQRQRGSRNPH